MPQWIHDRADHIRAKNPGMPKSESFAIATQQAHAAGKAPKGYGTAEGKRTAKKKYDEGPKSYVQTADPKTKTSGIGPGTLQGFADEMQKIANATGVAQTIRMGKTSLTQKPKEVSKPRDPEPPASQADLLRSTRTIQPPPVTAG